MSIIATQTDLAQAILQLELRQATEAQSLKDQVQYTYKSMQPLTLIKRTVDEVAEAREMHGEILDTVVSLAANYLSEAVMESTQITKKQKMIRVTSIIAAYKIYENRVLIRTIMRNIQKTI
jgi:hypothetical protein